MSDPTRPEVIPATEDGAASAPGVAEGSPDPHDLGLDLPDDHAEAVSLLLTELSTAREEATAYLDDLRRVAADFDNYRKRTMRESAAILDRATERVVQSLLPVLDSFDAGLTTTPGSDTEQLLYSGLVNTREQLLKALEAEGLEVIPTIGETFDPVVHEPVGAPAGQGRLMVADEVRRGYRLRGKVLRAALVTLEATE
jgi:molecular chaperone GrpE